MSEQLLNSLENFVTKKLDWKSVPEIPDIPFASFLDAQEKISTGEYATGVDYTTSNEMAQWLYGGSYKIFFLIFASAPIICAILSIYLSFSLNNFWLLGGMILGFLGQLTSNPYNPKKSFFTKVVFFLSIVSLWAMFVDLQTVKILTLFYIVPFLMNRFIYKNNQRKLTNVILKSEPVFIYLYQTGKLGFKDRLGKSYWHMEAVVNEMEDLLKKYKMD